MSGLIDIKNLYDAWIFFNETFFAGDLTPPIITWCRKKGAKGYFWADRYENRLPCAEGQEEQPPKHEIAFNPDSLRNRSDKDTLSTLVHEMCHQWQQEHGRKKPRRCYHNREWAEKMMNCGLIPSATGEPGGKQTGQSMTHYFLEGALFDYECDKLISGGWALTYQGIPPEKAASKSRDKVKYTCPKCDVKAWAKPKTALACAACNCEMYGEED